MKSVHTTEAVSNSQSFLCCFFILINGDKRICASLAVYQLSIALGGKRYSYDTITNEVTKRLCFLDLTPMGQRPGFKTGASDASSE